MTDFATALCLTVFIESAVALAWIRRRPPTDRNLVILFVAGLNLVTHPLAWWAHSVTPLPPITSFIVTECVVILLESAALGVIPGVTGRRALGAAMVMNAASASAGLLLF